MTDEVQVLQLSDPTKVTADDTRNFGLGNLVNVVIPDGVSEIGEEAFCGCGNLKQINIPYGVTEIGEAAFCGCNNLKEITLPDSVTKIDYKAFYGCESLEQVTIPDSVTEIDSNAFDRCKNLKQINISDSVTNIGCEVFSDNLEKIVYKGHVINREQMHFAEALSDGLNTAKRLDILARSREILNDDVFSPILVTKLCQAEHNGTLEQTAAKIQKDFNTIGFYEISSKVDLDAREKLVELFKNNTASRGVVPKIIDALTIASTTLHIAPETIVHAFEDKKFRDAIIAMRSCHKNNHFFDVEAVLFAMTFDVNEVKNVILGNPYKDYASVLLCDGYKNNNENCINAAKWIAAHPDTSKDIIDNIFKYKDYIDIAPEMTVPAIKTQFSKCEAQLETKRIEREYEGFKFEDCVCNLQKTEVEFGKYRAYIMDGQDPRQVMLGYDTNCCQHLGGAGETAMMYGLANPNAGFWVIEDKESGKILAQAECWEITSAKLNESVLTENIIRELLNGAISQGYIHVNDISKCFNNSVKDIRTDVVTYFDGRDYDPNDFALKIDKAGLITETALISNGSYLNLSDYRFNLFENDNVRNGFNAYCNDNNIDMTAFQNGDIQVNKNCFVFDNIEFADDRQIDQFAPIIAKWCEASPYDNVLMGNGYNEMVNGEIRKVDGVEPPRCEEYIEITGLSDIKLPQGVDISIIQGYEDVNFHSRDEVEDFKAEIFERLNDLGIIEYDSESEEFYSESIYGGCGETGINDFVAEIIDSAKDIDIPYTDADESCSLLKVNGQVEPYFVKAYESFKEAEKQCKEQQQKQKPEPRKEKSAYMKRMLAQIERQSHGRNISRDDFDR